MERAGWGKAGRPSSRAAPPPAARAAPSPNRARLALALCALATVPLAACDGRLETTPAASASSAACTQLLERLPRQLDGRQRRDVTGAGTAAWGDPAITLFCGVPEPGPTTDQCLSVGSGSDLVDWIQVPDGDANLVRFVTYGRSPAIEVQVPSAIGVDQPSGVLVGLAPAISPIPQHKSCT